LTHRHGYHTPTPYLEVDDAAGAIEFYREAFGASERTRLATPDGQIGHAELEIGDSIIMLCDPLPHFATRSPNELGGTSVGVFLYVDDADAAVRRPLMPGQRSSETSPTCSGVIASAWSPIPSDMSGSWLRTSRI
jgi:PhnB protein